MKKINKKGQWSAWGKIIIVLLILIISILLYNKFIKGPTTILLCNKNGGDCVAGTCDFMTQFPALGDKAAGCKSNEICCVNITQEANVDPNCKDKKVGDPCRTDESPNMYYCGLGNVCITRCEYCAKLWGDSTLTKDDKICPAVDKAIFTRNNMPTLSRQFTCACQITKDACNAQRQKDGTCVTGYCPVTDPDYVCCIKGPDANNAQATTTDTNTAPTTSTDTAPTYAPAQVIPSSTTGVTSDYDFRIYGNEFWFKADTGTVINPIDTNMVPNNCYLDTSNYNLMICKPNNMYSIPIKISVYNDKAIEVNADPFVVINSNGAQSTQSKALGTYLGLPFLMTYNSAPGEYYSLAETNIVINPSESIEGNTWTIYPGAICLSTECKNVNSDGILRTSTTQSLTIKFQSTTT